MDIIFCQLIHRINNIKFAVTILCRPRLKSDGTRAETSRGVRISGISAGNIMFRGSVMGTTHSIRQFPLHFPSRASPCGITFQLDSTTFSFSVNKLCIMLTIHLCSV
jgi:hypothetical protein